MSHTLVERYTPHAEVIDLDDWSADTRQNRTSHQTNDSQPSGSNAESSHRRRPTTHTEVIVIDSDDDDEVQITGFTAPVRQQRIRTPRRLLFSPPPPVRNEDVPPVPPLPRRLPPLPPLPPPRRPGVPQYRERVRSPPVPDLFIPMQQPFAFEANFPQVRRAPPPQMGNARQQANPANHRPALDVLTDAFYAFTGQARAPEDGAVRVHNEIERRNEGNGWLTMVPQAFRGLIGLREEFNRHEERLHDALARITGNDIDGRPRRQRHLPGEDGWQPYNPRLWMVGHNDHQAHGVGAGAGKTPDYKPAFTHAIKAPPGFTHNFAVPEEVIVIDVDSSPTSKTSSPTTTTAPGFMLVCGSCSDQLVMNVSGSEEEQRSKRVWGLRCGHVLDGKCIERLMKPTPLPPVVKPGFSKEDDKNHTSINMPSTSASGKRVAGASNTHESMVTLLRDSRKRRRLDKGKGKEKVEPVPESEVSVGGQSGGVSSDNTDERVVTELLRLGSDSSLAGLADLEWAPVATPDNIRSRLRPRRPANSQFTSGLSSFTNAPSTSLSLVSSSSIPLSPRGNRASRPFARSRPANARSARKSNSSRKHPHARTEPLKPVEQNIGTYEWKCPVGNCGRLHTSLHFRITTLLEDGGEEVKEEWRMDPEKGAIGVFV